MKDLFRLVFPHVSQFSFADYERDFVRNAPAWLLSAAGAAHDTIRALPDFDQVATMLAERSPGCWQNPELYPPLFRLLGKGHDAASRHRDWRALQVQLGVADIDAGVFTHRYFRLHSASPRTFEREGDTLSEIPDAVLMAEPGFPIVYRPVPHLFDDVIVKGIDYAGSPIPLSRDRMRRAIKAAMAMLGRYDPTLAAGFGEAVGTIAITGDWRPGDRIGYSTASIFPGAIFTSLCTDSTPLLVETFIHEYYHQRLWLWWLIEHPADMPDQKMTMISPVSGHRRAVRVMMQALLIYISLVDYYRWAEAQFPEEGAWIGHRSGMLNSGAKKLTKALMEALSGRPESRRFVRTVADHHHPMASSMPSQTHDRHAISSKEFFPA